MPHHHKQYVARGSSGGSAPAPLFRLQFGASGIATLPQTLDINSQQVSPTYWYEGRDGTTSNWTAQAGSGGTLTGQGVGGTADLDAPTPNASDRSFDCEAGRYFEGTTDVWVAQDAVAEMVFYYPSGTTMGLANARDNGTFQGWSIGTDGGQDSMVLELDDGTNTATVQSAISSLIPNSWNHAILFVDDSGDAAWFINGVASGGSTTVSGVGSLPATLDFQLGCGFDNGTDIADKITFFAMWLQGSWLDTHNQTTVAAERYGRCAGVYSADLTRKVDARLSAAVVERVSAEDGNVRFFQVGENWHRVDRVTDLSAETQDGYCAEEVRTNLVPDNSDLSALNTITNASMATDGTLDPFYTQAYGLTSTGVGDISHIAGHVEGATANRAGHVYVKAGARTICYVTRDSAGTNGFYFDLSGGTVGTQNGTITPRTQALGDGWYKLGFDLDTFSGAIQVYAIQTDNDLTYDATADAGGVALYMAYPQLELGTTTGEASTSTIITTGVAGTRIADELTYDITGIDLSVATLVCEVLHPDATPENNGRPIEVSDLTGANRHSFTYNGTTGEARVILRDGGVSQGTLTGTTVLVDGNWHEWRCTWQVNDYNLLVDGVSEDTDTLGTIPTLTELSIGVSLADTKQPNARLVPKLFQVITTTA